LLMAERFGCRVVAVDPADGNLAEGDRNISGSEHGHLVEIKPGPIEQIPAEDGRFSLVFSRDMMNHVIDIDRGLAECHRVLRPGGAMVVHLVTATELMEPEEAARLFSDLATVPERMSAPGFEAAVAAAGFSVESLDVVGSEWYEASQEAGTVPNYALQLSRLNRNRESYLERMGEVVYRSVYGNALWGVYMLIGKLETRLYVLRRGA
jgi:SAM-dependent methyltransferase